MEDLNKCTSSAQEQPESVCVPLASEQANINFQQFLTGLSAEERETKLDEQYLRENFRLKEIHSTLELNVVKNIYNTIVQKELQAIEQVSEIAQKSKDINKLLLSYLRTYELKSEFFVTRYHYVYRNRQMTDKRMKKNWTDDETSLLLWIVKVLSQRLDQEPVEFTDETWMEIAKMIPYKAFENCKLRWLYLKKNSVQCTPWTEEEDQKLREIILNKGANSNKWNEIAKDLYNSSASKTFRKGKQCRERWNNHLDPDMKRGQWTDIEDLQLLQLSYENGNKWSYIAKQLKERTENAVKNRYKSLLRKEEKENKTQSQSSQTGLSQASLQLISSNPQTEIIQTSTFLQAMNIPPDSPEQQKIFNIIIKLMNKISSDQTNPQGSNSIKQDERIEEEDNEEDCDEDDNNIQEEEQEDDEDDEDNRSPQSNTQIVKIKRKVNAKKSKKEDKLQQQRKCSNETEMQIEGKNENTPTAAHTDCNTTDLQMSDNKVTTQSTIFTPSSSPNRAFSQLKHDDENKQEKHQTSIFCQKNNIENNNANLDEVTTANTICSNVSQPVTKAKKTPKQTQPKKKKQSNATNSEVEKNNKQGGVSTFSDALMFQPISSMSRSSSPSLANIGENQSAQENAKKKKQKKQEKNDTASLTTASTATNRDSAFNQKKIHGFVQRNSIQSCSTPIGQSSLLNPYYANNAAPSPNTQLVNQFNNLYIHSTENTPSSSKRRNTFSTSDFQSSLNIENLYKRRNCNKQTEDDSENSQEEERGQKTKKIIVLTGKTQRELGINIQTIDESEEANLKKMDIEQESGSFSQQQIIGLNSQHTLSLFQQHSNSDDNMMNNENLNNLNIMKKFCSSQSSISNHLKFSGNNSAFKQFCSSPLQGSLIRPKQSSLQLQIGGSSLGQSPLQNSSKIQDQIINSPMNSPLFLSQLNQCIEQQQSTLLTSKNIDFTSLMKQISNSSNKTPINTIQQQPLISKSESQNKGFQKNKNFKQPSLFQPTNPSVILTNNQQ